MEENLKVRIELLDTVSALTDAELNRCVDDDSWSIMQVMEHLYLMETVVANAIATQLASEEKRVATEKPIHLTVNRSVKVEAPSFVVPSKEFQTLEDMKGKLAKSRAALERVVQNADESLLTQRSNPHPVFGELSLSQWIPFIGFHEKRHIAQIEEIKEKLK